MKQGGTGKHAFGDASWWGKELFGIDNALVGNWPWWSSRNGKAVIKEFRSIPNGGACTAICSSSTSPKWARCTINAVEPGRSVRLRLD